LERVLVFTRTKRGADRVCRLQQAGVAAEAFHGNKGQNARIRALEAFRSGRVRVLVATDITARGLDVAGISYVINYELPNELVTCTGSAARRERALEEWLSHFAIRASGRILRPSSGGCGTGYRWPDTARQRIRRLPHNGRAPRLLRPGHLGNGDGPGVKPLSKSRRRAQSQRRAYHYRPERQSQAAGRTGDLA
jgi:superfamily II DNA/RNA helicase